MFWPGRPDRQPMILRGPALRPGASPRTQKASPGAWRKSSHTMAEIQDMAKSLGQALGRTSEYQALDRAMKSANDDRDMVELKNEIEKMESAFQTVLSQGQQPGQEAVEEYENTIRKLQSLSSYQALVAAQANFEKVMAHVNQSIQAGMVEGAASRIIIPS